MGCPQKHKKHGQNLEVVKCISLLSTIGATACNLLRCWVSLHWTSLLPMLCKPAIARRSSRGLGIVRVCSITLSHRVQTCRPQKPPWHAVKAPWGLTRPHDPPLACLCGPGRPSGHQFGRPTDRLGTLYTPPVAVPGPKWRRSRPAPYSCAFRCINGGRSRISEKATCGTAPHGGTQAGDIQGLGTDPLVLGLDRGMVSKPGTLNSSYHTTCMGCR